MDPTKASARFPPEENLEAQESEAAALKVKRRARNKGYVEAEAFDLPLVGSESDKPAEEKLIAPKRKRRRTKRLKQMDLFQ